jgi:hypothetical protein
MRRNRRGPGVRKPTPRFSRSHGRETVSLCREDYPSDTAALAGRELNYNASLLLMETRGAEEGALALPEHPAGPPVAPVWGSVRGDNP